MNNILPKISNAMWDNDAQKRTEKHLADLGWERMRDALDRELPAQKNDRRRGLVWVFVGLFLATAAAGFWPVFFDKKEVRFEKKEPTVFSKPAEVATAENSVSTKNLIEKQSDGQSFHKKSDSKISTKKTTEPTISKKQAVDFSPKIFDKKEVSAAAISESGFSGFLDFREATTTSTFQKFSAPPPLETVDFEKKEAARFSSAFNFLSLENRRLGSVASLKNGEPKNPTLVFKRHRRSPRFGLTANAQTIDFQRLNGYSVSVLSEWRLSRRARLSVGLSWNHVVRSSRATAAKDFYIDSNTEIYTNQTTDSSFFFAEIDPNAVPIFGPIPLQVAANVFNRLEIPVVFSWKIGSRWLVSGGLSASWLVSAKSQIGGGLFSLSKSSNSDPAATNDLYAFSSSKSVNAFLTSNLPRFDLAASASVGFDLSKNWRLGLSFQRGLFNQNEVSTIKKFNKTTQFSVTRFF